MATGFWNVIKLLQRVEMRLAVSLMLMGYEARKVRLTYHLIEVKYLRYSTQTYKAAWTLACHSPLIPHRLIVIQSKPHFQRFLGRGDPAHPASGV